MKYLKIVNSVDPTSETAGQMLKILSIGGVTLDNLARNLAGRMGKPGNSREISKHLNHIKNL